MKNLVLIIFLIISCKENTSIKKNKQPDILKKQISSIEKQLLKIENKLSKYKKKTIDLDNDGDMDFIYLYQCGEPKCIDIYINVDKKLKKKISETYFEYSLDSLNNKIHIKHSHCCGESPFVSFRSFKFLEDEINLNANYVIFNESNEILLPKGLLKNSYLVEVLKENYNVRFSPNIKKYQDEDSEFSCVANTNIIGKLKRGSIIRVLYELKKEKRTWFFVEIQKLSLKDNLCNSPISFNFENQHLRAWVSAKFLKKN